MLKKYLTVIVATLLINLSLNAVSFAEAKETKAADFAEKVKAEIARLGTGANAKVEVKLRDKTKLKGYVSPIDENSFVVIDEKTGAATEVPYPNAKQVKGNNLSTGVKVIIGVAIVVGVLLIVGYVVAPLVAQ